MLPTRFRFIWLIGFRIEDFLEIDLWWPCLLMQNLQLWNRLAKWTETWWEAPMEGSVLSFLKAEWKVSDTDSAHWASSFVMGKHLSVQRFTFLVQDHPMIIPAKSQFNWLSGFWQEDF
jgi:hypothetical protein